QLGVTAELDSVVSGQSNYWNTFESWRLPDRPGGSQAVDHRQGQVHQDQAGPVPLAGLYALASAVAPIAVFPSDWGRLGRATRLSSKSSTRRMRWLLESIMACTVH